MTTTIFGHTYEIGFDFSTLVEYEEATGKSFDLSKIDTISLQTALYYAVLKSFNDDFQMTLKEFRKKLSMADITVMSESVPSLVKDFFNVEDIAESHVERGEENESTANP